MSLARDIRHDWKAWRAWLLFERGERHFNAGKALYERGLQLRREIRALRGTVTIAGRTYTPRTF